MITGKTQSGYHYSLDPSAMNNMELVDAIAELDGGNTLAMSTICRLLLDTDQRKRLYDHLRTETGRVPVEAVAAEMEQLIQACGDSAKK